MGGHYDSSPTSASAVVVSTQVSYLPDTAVGPTSSMQDLSNTGSLLGQGGRPVKVVVHCLDGAGGRQLEVEFGIRFGL